MSAIGTYIKSLRKELRWARQVVGHKTGLPPARIAQHEQGTRIPSLQDRRRYALAFGFADVLEFDEGWRGRRVTLSRGDPQGRIPVINRAPAGPPADYEECYPDSGIGYEYIDRTPGVEGENLFAFVVVGDSMAPNFLEGDYVVCCPVLPEEIEDGEAVFVRFGAERDHRCTFKRVFMLDKDHVELRADNSSHAAQVVPKQHIVRMSPVVEWRRRMKRRPPRRIAEDVFRAEGTDTY